MRISSILMILVIGMVLQISIVDEKKYWNWLHLGRLLSMLKVHRSTSSCLRRMQELFLINTIMPLKQRQMDYKPVYPASIPYPNSKERFSCFSFQSGRNEVEHHAKPQMCPWNFPHVKVALRATDVHGLAVVV